MDSNLIGCATSWLPTIPLSKRKPPRSLDSIWPRRPMPPSSAWTKRAPSRPSIVSIPCCRSLRDGPSVMGLSISVTAPSPFRPPWRPEAARSPEALPGATQPGVRRFLQEVVATQPSGKEIHLIVDNLSAHKTKRVERLRMPWLSDWVLQQPVCDSLYIRDSRSKDPPRA